NFDALVGYLAIGTRRSNEYIARLYARIYARSSEVSDGSDVRVRLTSRELHAHLSVGFAGNRKRGESLFVPVVVYGDGCGLDTYCFRSVLQRKVKVWEALGFVPLHARGADIIPRMVKSG